MEIACVALLRNLGSVILDEPTGQSIGLVSGREEQQVFEHAFMREHLARRREEANAAIAATIAELAPSTEWQPADHLVVTELTA